MEEHFRANILKAGKWLRLICRLKFFLFLALVAILFDEMEPLRPSWISDQHNFNSFRSKSHSVATEQSLSFGSKQPKVCKEMLKICFQGSGCGGHFRFSIGSFSYFVSTRRPKAHHQVSIQLDYRGDVQNMNSQHYSHINI